MILLESRDQEIKTLEHLLRGYTSYSSPEVATADAQKEMTKNEEINTDLTLNKLNRTNIRTIGAVLSNRSRDRDRYKFRPLNKVKSNAN